LEWPLPLLRVFSPFWCLDAKWGEDSYLYQFLFYPMCNGLKLYVCWSYGQNLFMLASKTFMEI
jgi:hypothetical protein